MPNPTPSKFRTSSVAGFQNCAKHTPEHCRTISARRFRTYLPLSASRKPLVVVDHFSDHEIEPLLRKLGVEVAFFRQGAKPGELDLLPIGVGGRHPVGGLQSADLLSETESLREQVHECGIDIVDTLPNRLESFGSRLFIRHVSRLLEVSCLERAAIS